MQYGNRKPRELLHIDVHYKHQRTSELGLRRINLNGQRHNLRGRNCQMPLNPLYNDSETGWAQHYLTLCCMVKHLACGCKTALLFSASSGLVAGAARPIRMTQRLTQAKRKNSMAVNRKKRKILYLKWWSASVFENH